MASNEVEQLKLLNSELQHQVLALRASLIRQEERRRQDHIDIIKFLMRQLEVDQQCLAMDQEPKSPQDSLVLNGRSFKEICQETRQFSAVISSPRTISPAKRSGRIATNPNEAPGLVHPTNASAPSYSSSPVPSDALVQPRQVLRPIDPNVYVTAQSLDLEQDKSAEKQSSPLPRVLVTQPSPPKADSLISSPSGPSPLGPRRSLSREYLQMSGDTSTTIPNGSSPQLQTATKETTKGCPGPSGNQPKPTPPPKNLVEIISCLIICPAKPSDPSAEKPKETPEFMHTSPEREIAEIDMDISPQETDLSAPSYSTSHIPGDSSMEMCSPTQQVLHSLDLNVSATDKENSIEEHPSIQDPRLLMPQHDPTLFDSLLSSPSFINTRKRGSKTSSPISNGSYPLLQTDTKETTKGCPEPSGNQTKETAEETDLSAPSYSTSHIPSDSTMEMCSPTRQVLHSVDLNVSAADKENSIEKNPSIQVPRLLMPQHDPTLLDSLMSSPSFVNTRKRGSKTSTPISSRPPPQQQTATKETLKQPKKKYAAQKNNVPSVRYSCSPISSDSADEESIQEEEVSVASGMMLTRPKCKPAKPNGEQLSTRVAKPLVTQLDPQESLPVRGSNTSTPISNRSPPQQQTATKETLKQPKKKYAAQKNNVPSVRYSSSPISSDSADEEYIPEEEVSVASGRMLTRAMCKHAKPNGEQLSTKVAKPLVTQLDPEVRGSSTSTSVPKRSSPQLPTVAKESGSSSEEDSQAFIDVVN